MPGLRKNIIKLALAERVNAWISSVKDEELQKKLRQDTLVSGGAIASMLAGEKVNDYDIYFTTKETALAVAEYYVKVFNETKGTLPTKAIRSCNPEVKLMHRQNILGDTEERVIIYMKSAGVASETQDEYKYFEYGPEMSTDEFINSVGRSVDNEMDDIKANTDPIEVSQELNELTKEKGKFRPVFFSENAITLSDKVQLVVRFWGDPDKIHENYDYAHAMCCYHHGTGDLKLHPEALESILSKTLIYRGSLYPMASLFRTRKFIERGWRISAGQMLKIIWQLNKVDLNNSAILREQLLGVDQAYFSELLRALENKAPGERVDATYLAKLVDQIFE